MLHAYHMIAAGVTVANIPQIKQLGFAGAAVLGSVWSSADPVAACAELLTACEYC